MNLSALSIKRINHYVRVQPIRLIFLLLWVAAAIKIMMVGDIPSPMALESSQQGRYNFGLVAGCLIAMSFHLGVLVAIDVYIKKIWKFVWMLAVTTGLLLFFGIMLIHAPEALLWLILWLVISFAVLFFVCFGLAWSLLLDLIFKK